MKTLLFSLIFLLSELFTINVQAQVSDSCNCLPLYTHAESQSSKIQIEKIVVLDSAKYSTLPSPVEDLDSLSSLLVYPKIAERALISGVSKYLVTINSDGGVERIKQLLGKGAGLDEVPLNVLWKMKFNPAKIKNKAVECDVYVFVNFMAKKIIDEPDFVFDEIKYESPTITGHPTYILVFRKDRSANFIQITGDGKKESAGKIREFDFLKLSDFIISQGFFCLDSIYIGEIDDSWSSTITVKYGDVTKSVSQKRGNHYPISYWAIYRLMKGIKDDIKWEVVNFESYIKKLPIQKDK